MNRIFKLQIEDNRIGLEYDYAPGHRFGQGQRSPDGRFNVIHIPKNASSEIKRQLPDWEDSNYRDRELDTQHLIIFRDPTERWISGMAEFLVGRFSHMGGCNGDISEAEIEEQMSGRLFRNMLFNFVVFDVHTLPQCCFLQGLDLGRATFFYHDETVVERVLDHVGRSRAEVQFTNRAGEDGRKLMIMDLLRQELAQTPTLQHSIDKHYYADHGLKDRVEFRY
jgi:hypothetical protein